jgi:hypothetical protein
MAKQSLTLRKKAALLREYGFNVNYGKRGKTGKQFKGSVTRAWQKVFRYVENEKQEFTFKKAKKSDLKSLKYGLGKKAITPGGFFIKIPKGVRKTPDVKVREDGAIEYEATGPKGGKIKEVIHRVDPLLVADDLDAEVERLRKSDPMPDDVGMTVNGFDSPMTEEYDLETLTAYLAYDLFPRLRDPNIDPGHAKKHGKRKLSDDEIADIFHLKFSYYTSPKNAKKTGTTNRRR